MADRKTSTINIGLPDMLARQIRAQANLSGVMLKDWCREALEKQLNEQRSEPAQAA